MSTRVMDMPSPGRSGADSSASAIGPSAGALLVGAAATGAAPSWVPAPAGADKDAADPDCTLADVNCARFFDDLIVQDAYAAMHHPHTPPFFELVAGPCVPLTKATPSGCSQGTIPQMWAHQQRWLRTGVRALSTSGAARAKIVAPPLVYIAGEEMSRYAGELYLNEWIRCVPRARSAPRPRALRTAGCGHADTHLPLGPRPPHPPPVVLAAPSWTSPSGRCTTCRASRAT